MRFAEFSSLTSHKRALYTVVKGRHVKRR